MVFSDETNTGTAWSNNFSPSNLRQCVPCLRDDYRNCDLSAEQNGRADHIQFIKMKSWWWFFWMALFWQYPPTSHFSWWLKVNHHIRIRPRPAGNFGFLSYHFTARVQKQYFQESLTELDGFEPTTFTLKYHFVACLTVFGNRLWLSSFTHSEIIQVILPPILENVSAKNIPVFIHT